MQEAIYGKRLVYPCFIYPNFSWIGDGALLEPIARMSAVQGKSYILSSAPEIFEGHPTVEGLAHRDQFPENAKIIDLNDAINSIANSKNGKVVLPEKSLRMWQAAGFPRVMDHPRLYLTPVEIAETRRMKRWFNKPCIGIVLHTRNRAKDWAYTMVFIRTLMRERQYDVFVFGKDVSRTTLAAMPAGVHYYLDLDLRDVMQGLFMMDVVVGPDTGLMHLAGALGTQRVIPCFGLFADLHEQYPGTTVLANDNFKLHKGITGISVRKVLKCVDAALYSNRHVISVTPQQAPEEKKELCFIRIRGSGDVLRSLVALATFKKLDPSWNITYITSPGVAELVRLSKVADNVVEVNYDHPSGGLPLPPPGYDYDGSDSVINAINKVDFGQEGIETPRAELFGRLLGLDEVDYSTDWQFEIPKSWVEIAKRKLESAGIDGSKKTIVMQADSKGLSRVWQMARQKEFIGLARKAYNVVVVSDQEIKYAVPVINLTGKLSFTEYVGMIGAGDILVCPDSGGLHIAGATNNLALGLFGSVHPDLRISDYETVHYILGKAKCVPCNDWQLHVCKGEKKNWPMCMWSIKADQVVRRIRQLLKAEEAKTNAV